MKTNRIFLCMTIISAGLIIFSETFFALAAQSMPQHMKFLKLADNEIIQIESGTLEVHDQENKAYFTKDVKVVQGTTTLQADEMVVLYRDKNYLSGNGIRRINIARNILMKSGMQQVTAEKGFFDFDTKIFVLTGKQVVLTQGSNVFIGCKFVVHTDTGDAKLDSCNNRVKIQLDPKSSNMM
ncbi:hypothetical protein B488_13010 [Liberibacter crescens BT-1]|uniref:Organic solvent tolerance-like N-terminal domain-containing protein n=1 Tax=Liberibacter crescens (strain BT-1) TaxID=1215343 RepID=L0EXA4_LIBCB|nr:LptA/OstA family protein [Liberibacter crescens]AGA65293.1 hypothetical protein B488_13010 [Liberibacter crescens BT-1]AMC13226.1 hypothetical protein RL73_06580 [Liberibacter crescens]